MSETSPPMKRQKTSNSFVDESESALISAPETTANNRAGSTNPSHNAAGAQFQPNGKDILSMDANAKNLQQLKQSEAAISAPHKAPVKIDEGLYSRQLYVIGRDGMRRMATSRILLVVAANHESAAVNGLALEIAKNVVLAGVKSLTLCLAESSSSFGQKIPVCESHLEANFFVNCSDVGQSSLAALLQQRLAELNSYVELRVIRPPPPSSSTSNDREKDKEEEQRWREFLANKYDVAVLCMTPSSGAGWSDRQLIAFSRACSPPTHSSDCATASDSTSCPVKLVFAQSSGVFGRIFCDFGDDFVVSDVNGEEPLSVMINHIERSEQGLVTCLEETKHGFEDGDYVTFREVRGMTQLNSESPRQIKVVGPESFAIGDTRQLSEYERGGICTQVKMPRHLQFKRLDECLVNPDADSLMISDFAKMERPRELHEMFRALDAFRAAHSGDLPHEKSKEDAAEFAAIFSANQKQHRQEEKQSEEQLELARTFARVSRGDLAPVHSVLGGIAAQEVLKAVSGRFVPIQQWLYFDCVECLPVAQSDSQSRSNGIVHEQNGGGKKNGSHHDATTNGTQDADFRNQIRVFGADFQEKLRNLKLFVVGAGAIGCELLKNLALMGVATPANKSVRTNSQVKNGDDLIKNGNSLKSKQGGGEVIVTDMDLIERSNLNRQFLFRNEHIGKSKSAVAAQAVMRKHARTHTDSHTDTHTSGGMRITAHQNKVGGETEAVYNDTFFEQLDCVLNALDNVEARLYMDRRCVFYRLALLESGTLGTKGNTQVVLPGLTESYGSSPDPPEKSIPQCTLIHFPFRIEHTVQWARDQFEGLFAQPSRAVLRYWGGDEGATTSGESGGPDAFLQRIAEQRVKGGTNAVEVRDTLVALRNWLTDPPRTFADCVRRARDTFQQLFHDGVCQLLHNFPPHASTKEGAPFWSGTKRCPRAIAFDAAESRHIDFVHAAANIWAHAFGVLPAGGGGYEMDRQEVHRVVAQLPPLNEFTPKHNVVIATNDAELSRVGGSSGAVSDSDELDSLVAGLPKRREDAANGRGCAVVREEFEKDSDSNWHMEFVTAASNLRAQNYAIEPADKLKTKLIAGKIIPAIATTTSLVAGLVCLELYKIAQGHKKIEQFKNGFVNLALPFIAFSEPLPPKLEKYYDKQFSLWDRFELEEQMTLKQLLDYFKEEHKLKITMLSQDVCLLYSFFLNQKANKERMHMTIEQLVQTVSKKPLPEHANFLVLDMTCSDENDEDVDVPYIRYKIHR